MTIFEDGRRWTARSLAEAMRAPTPNETQETFRCLTICLSSRLDRGICRNSQGYRAGSNFPQRVARLYPVSLREAASSVHRRVDTIRKSAHPPPKLACRIKVEIRVAWRFMRQTRTRSSHTMYLVAGLPHRTQL